MLRAVIFDLWNTLIADTPEGMAQREEVRLSRLAQAFGASREAVEPAYGALREELTASHRRGEDLSLPERARIVASRLGSDGDTSAAEEAFAAPVVDLPPPLLPGALDAVAGVRARGLSVGLISNTGASPGRGLRRVLHSYGLLAHFDVTLFSDEQRLSKPAAAIFHRALEALGVTPQEAVFVGDDAVLDVRGPQSAGLWTVQLGDHGEDSVRPHARIGRLDELFAALRALGLVRDPT